LRRWVTRWLGQLFSRPMCSGFLRLISRTIIPRLWGADSSWFLRRRHTPSSVSVLRHLAHTSSSSCLISSPVAAFSTRTVRPSLLESRSLAVAGVGLRRSAATLLYSRLLPKRSLYRLLGPEWGLEVALCLSHAGCSRSVLYSLGGSAFLCCFRVIRLRVSLIRY